RLITGQDFVDGAERIDRAGLWAERQAARSALLERCLESDLAWVRAAATKSLRYAYPEPAGVLGHLERAVVDADPRVRLEAVAALTWRDELEAGAIALRALEQPLEDKALAYVFDEALQVLREPLLGALDAGKPLAIDAAGLAALYGSASTERLHELSPQPARDAVLLSRGDAPIDERRAALNRLTAGGEVDPAAAIADLFLALEAAEDAEALDELVPLLLREAGRLAGDEARTQAFRAHRLSHVRQLGWRIQIEAGGEPRALLAEADLTRSRLEDLLGAVAQGTANDGRWREPLRERLDAPWEPGPPTMAARLRLTVPGEDRIINISEVELFAGDANVARSGTARSSSVDWDGPPEAGIDGHIIGAFAPKQMVHTRQETDPWFEVELSEPAPVTRVHVWNRTQKPLDQRLDGFRLELFDADGALLWSRHDLPAPEEVGAYGIELDDRPPRAALLRALTHTAPDAHRPKELLAELQSGDERLALAAEAALAALPPTRLEALDLTPLAERLTAALETATWEQRFEPAFAARLRAAEQLATRVDHEPLVAALAAEASQPSLDRFLAGREHYVTNCSACHQEHGRGIPGAYPPLAGSSWVLGDPQRPIRIALHGLQGEIDLDGVRYTGAMAPLGPLLDDQQLADLLTYARNAWGNQADAVAADQVASVRKANAKRRRPWTARELGSD
ncbi:MAG: cytochrome c, partial [Planctomycetota bacterium]